jgi:hypothetical protein
MLSGEDPFCEHEIALPAKGRVLVLVMPSELMPGSQCTVELT